MNILIIEDESAAVRRLRKLIAELLPESNILADLDAVETAIQWLQQNRPPDLIFLDIHLADGSCFEIFQHVKIERPIIFTTAYDQYALQAFKLNAVDYLLKPIKKEELEQAINRARPRLEAATIDYVKLAQALNAQQEKRFLVKIGQQIKLINIDEAAYFFSQNKITYLVAYNGKKYPVDYSLEAVEGMVDPKHFFRINRQFIIHINAINEMIAFSKSRVKVHLNPPSDLETIVSTERSPQFKKWLIGE